MKNSGIEWIGEIPDSWKVVETKFLFDIFSGATPDTNSSDNWDGNINWITPADFKSDDVYVTKGKKSITTQGLNSCSARLVPENSLIFSKRAPIGAVAITRSELCTNQGCLSCVNKGQVVTKYYYYVMRAAEEIYELYGAGTTFKEIAALKFANFILPYPSVSEQETIQRNLSNRIKRVDKLIEVQQAQIDKLKEYKQSVITEAVTKGLDPTVPMKDSGVEWIGMIPESWNVVQLSSLFYEHKCKNLGMKATNLLSLSYGTIKRKNIATCDGLLPESFEGYNVIDNGDIVLRLTDLQNDQRSLRTGLSMEKGIVTSAYVTLRKRNLNVDVRFMHFFLHAFDVSKGFYGLGSGVRQGLNFDGIRKLTMLLPSIDEQIQIADYLDDKCAKIDKLIAIKQAKIDKLQEYKKSLIYEYVTGKKEVM